ncbi:MAG: DUF4340 domain-containing protein [Bacteroidota bacterium]
MKKSRNIIVLFGVLAVLISLYLFLKYRPQEKADEPNVASETVTLVNLENEKIKQIALKTKKHMINFIKKGEQWTSNLAFPITESEVNGLSYVFFGLRAEQVIDESPEDLEQYGLKDPAVTIEVTAVNETKPTIMYLGDLTPAGTSYYFKLHDDPAVYTIGSYHGEKFLLTPADFRDNSLARIDIEKINYFKLSRTGQPDLEIRINTEDSEFAQYGIGIWQMTKPYQEPMPVVTDKFQSILQSITSITNADRFIDDNPADLSRYGLAKPRAEVLIKDNQSQFSLLIGKPVNDEAFYCKKPDSKAVFTISSNDLFFLDTKAFELVEKFAYIVNIDDVDKIQITGLGSHHDLSITRKEKKSSTADSPEFDASYQIDGKKVKEQLFKSAYQSIIGLTVESECPTEPKNQTPELTMTFSLNKGVQRKILINYVPYDYDFYAVFRGGKAEFLISKDQVKSMLNELKATIEGKNKNN